MHIRPRMWAAGVAVACAVAFGLSGGAPAQAAPTATGTPQSTVGYKPAGCAVPVPPPSGRVARPMRPVT